MTSMQRVIFLASWLAVTSMIAAVACDDDPGIVDGDADVDGDGDGDADEADGAVEELQCGDEREAVLLPPSPVINGVDVHDPDVVSLTEGQVLAVGAILQNMGGQWMNVCTATLTTPTLVVTAAHCVMIIDWESQRTANPSELRFAIGRDAASPDHVFTPETVARHSAFDLWALGNGRDVGVLVLAHPATDEVPEISPIPMNLDPIARDEFVNQRVQNVGYGITDEYDWNNDNSLRWWTVQEVVDMSSGEFTCAGWGETGVCNGDSGGPSLFTLPDGVVRIMGVVSWGEERCVDNTYFTLLEHNTPFLEDFLEDCGDITEAGHCEDEVAVYCDGHTVIRTDCEARGLVCGEDEAEQMRCVEWVDPCEGETLEGRCEDGEAIWCEGEVVHRELCEAPRWSCDETPEGQTRCIEDPCEGLTLEGECDGDTARWCESGVIKERRCADCEQQCAWSDEHNAIYCI